MIGTLVVKELISWFKINTESIERRKTSFTKETVKTVDLHDAVLKKQ